MTGHPCLSVVLSLRFKLNLEICEQSLFLSSSLKECFKISPPHSGQNWIAFGPYLDHSKIVSHYLDHSEFPAQNLFYLVVLLVICTKPLNFFLDVHVLKRSWSELYNCTVLKCWRIFCYLRMYVVQVEPFLRVFPDLPNQFSVKIETIVQGTVNKGTVAKFWKLEKTFYEHWLRLNYRSSLEESLPLTKFTILQKNVA